MPTLELTDRDISYIRLKLQSLSADPEGVYQRIANSLDLIPTPDSPLSPEVHAQVEAAIACARQ